MERTVCSVRNSFVVLTLLLSLAIASVIGVWFFPVLGLPLHARLILGGFFGCVFVGAFNGLRHGWCRKDRGDDCHGP